MIGLKSNLSKNVFISIKISYSLFYLLDIFNWIIGYLDNLNH